MWKDFLFERCTLGLVYSRRNLCWYFSESIVSKPNLSLFALYTQTFQKLRWKLCLAPFWFLYSSKHFALICLLVLVLVDPVLKGCDQPSQTMWYLIIHLDLDFSQLVISWSTCQRPLFSRNEYEVFPLFQPFYSAWCVLFSVPSQFSLSV